MSITTYTELKTAVENWLDHTLFTARVPEFIALFEATANRRLRVQQQETQGAALIPSAVNGSVLLPADYLAWRHVTWLGTPTVELSYVAPAYLEAAYPTLATGIPAVFTIEGMALKIRPLSTTGIRLDYFQQVPALTRGRDQLAAHRASRSLSLRRSGRGRNVRGERRTRAALEGSARRNLR
jgi:hypothetical protein